MATATMESADVLEIRKALGLTQTQMADRLGVDRSAVAQWEGGFTKPSGPAQILLRQLQAEGERLARKKMRNGD